MKRPPDYILRWSLLGIAAILCVLAAWQIVAMVSSGVRAAQISKVAERWQPAKNTTGNASAQNNDQQTTETTTLPNPAAAATPAADPYVEISVAGFFGPPMPDAPPPTISAIIADTAIIDGQEVRVGAMVGAGYKLMEIHQNKAVVEKNGKKTDLVLFANGGNS